MGSLKALTLAGAVAMLAVPTAIVPAARAADLLPPPPQLEPLPVPVNDSGFYLRGDVGVAINDGYGLNSTFSNGGTLVGQHAWDGPLNVGDSGLFDIGVGYQFNSWFRADLLAGYLSSASYNSKVFYVASSCLPGVCGDAYTGMLRSGLFLANGYVDLGTWMGVTPYVGGGIGFASYSMSGFNDINISVPGAWGLAPNKSGTDFAWDVAAGMLFHVTSNFLLDMSYRYINMGSVSTGAIACNGGCSYQETQHFNMDANVLSLGMIWLMPTYVPPVVTAKY